MPSIKTATPFGFDRQLNDLQNNSNPKNHTKTLSLTFRRKSKKLYFKKSLFYMQDVCQVLVTTVPKIVCTGI